MKPVLSVVATSRNDDHGGHLNERMQWFVDGLSWHATRCKVAVELLMVEWNPPEGRAPLPEILRWPSDTDWLSARILTVPAKVHRDLAPDSTMPMLQMIAKNVGIRRAVADAVLSTNIDVLLTDELFSASVAGIGEGAVWRADRYDVEFPFPPLADVGAALEFCRHHPIRYERRDGVYYPDSGRVLPIYQSIGDFASYEVRRGARAVGARFGLGARRSGPSRPRAEASGPRTAASIARWGVDRARALYDVGVLPKLPVNACGDFTLLAKSDWQRLRGYPEWVVHSWHLDTVFLHQADGSNMRFVELAPPCVVYHMEHAQGSGWTPEGHTEHMKTVEQKGMRALTSAELRQLKRRFVRSRRDSGPVLLNGEGWGLVDQPIAEARAIG